MGNRARARDLITRLDYDSRLRVPITSPPEADKARLRIGQGRRSHPSPTSSARDQGVALLVVVGYLAIITMFAAALLRALNISLDESKRAEHVAISLNLAEAGLDKAAAALHANPGYRGETATPLGDGNFSVEVIPGEQPSTFRLVSVGELRYDDIPLHRSRIVAYLRLAADASVQELHWTEVKK
ncbi:MAG: hypothetical protein HY706_16445 [Candidatus Hydrogenedentes bacterium]|nr:hypothetical protein [Candidatus Hydrogenedentota bacterium]